MSVDISYYAFSPSLADENWKYFLDDISLLRKKYGTEKSQEIELNERQQKLTNFIGYLISNESYDEFSAFAELKFVDLSYGSITAQFSEDEKEYDPVLEAFGVGSSEELVNDKNIWFEIYNKLDDQVITEKAKEMQNMEIADGANVGDCEWLIRDFFVSMKPLIKFIKENSDAILLRVVHGYDIFDPKSADGLFVDRAKAAREKYKGLIPPVL